MNTKGTLFQICLLGAALLILPAAAQAQFTWTTNSGTITITGYTNSAGGAVTIPDTITGLPVTSIGAQAFYHATKVTSVMTGTNLTSIGQEAFQLCSGLASITIGTNVTSLGLQTFFGCSSLASVTLPASVTSIGAYAFTGCSSLAAILVVPSNPDFASVDGVLFNESQTTLIAYPGGLAGAYTIPSGATSIGEGAFDSCASLTSVTITNSVTSIEEDAFSACRGLTSVTLSNNVTSIGYESFANCSSLPSVAIPASVTSIGEYAFGGCTKLTNFTVAASNPDYRSIGGILFNPNQTTLVEFPGGLTGAYTISNIVTSIGAEAFGGCTNLTSVIIPASVTSVGDFAFEECGSLTGAYFLGNAPAPGSNVFIDVNARAKVYYYAGTTGWTSTYGGLPTVMLIPPPQLTGAGVRGNEFGFTIAGTNSQVVVVEACTNLVNANWQPIQTNILSGTSFNFTDPQWTNYSIRFYRLDPTP